MKKDFITLIILLLSPCLLCSQSQKVDNTSGLINLKDNTGGLIDPGVSTWPEQYMIVYNTFTTKPSAVIANAQALLVRRLVDGGIWAKRDIFYMFAVPTNDNSEALLNWKSPGTNDATLVNAPTFTTLEGFTGGNEKYIRSNFEPSTEGVTYTPISHSLAIGIATDVSENAYDFGGTDIGVTTGVRLLTGIAGLNALAYDYCAAQYIRRTGTRGHWYMSRSGNNLDLYKNIVKTSYEVKPLKIAPAEIFILSSNRAGVGPSTYSTKQVRWFAAGGYLTMAEVKLETKAIEEYLLTIGSNLYAHAPDNDLILTANGTVDVEFELAGIAGSAPVVVNWEDGANSGLTLDGAYKIFRHTYSAEGEQTITISHANSLVGVKFGHFKASNCEGDISAFNVCSNLETLELHPGEGDLWIGNIDGLNKGLKRLIIKGRGGPSEGHTTGTITPFVNLEYFHVSSDYDGDLSKAINLVNIFFNGGMTVTVDVSNMRNLEVLDSYGKNTYATGDLKGCTKLKQICWGTPNEFYGDITGCSDFEYLDNYGGSEITGDITGLTKLWKFRSYNSSNAFTGAITPNHTALVLFSVMNDNSNITKPTTIAANKLICTFQSDCWAFKSAEVNQILADLWANRNIDKGFAKRRMINLSHASSEAPTGQGLTDKAALQSYSSPTPPGTAALWTITTN